MTSPTFICGHERSRDNSTAEKRPQCRICRNAMARERFTVFKCGHPVTEENTRWNGRNNQYRRCRTCDNERAAEAQRRYDAKRRIEAERKARVDAECAVIALYRAEKAASVARTQGRIMREAKHAFAAVLKRDEELRKGGRPRKNAGAGAFPTHCAKARPSMPQVHRDRIPDLASQLNPFYGSGAA